MKTLTLLTLSATALASTACYDFNVTDPNAPTTASIYGNPTKANMVVAATGILAQARADMEAYVWRLGSMGREGINLSGNNQPDYQEPFYGPLSNTQFGGSEWGNPYIEIRLDNLYIDAIPHSPDLTAGEKNASIAFGETQKALALFYVIQTRAQLGAPVEVDLDPSGPPGPWVGEDSVYRAIIDLLADARTKLASASDFPFTMPPGYAAASTPQTFAQFTQALEAKAWVFRATDVNGCKGAKATCYSNAMTLLDSLFNVTHYADAGAANFQNGVFFDFSANPGDLQNGLSDPLNGTLYFALPEQQTDAEAQSGSATPDARVGAKIVDASITQILGGIPIHGTLKYSIYFTNGQPNPAAEIPILRDEELVLLKAEAELGLGQLAAATTDLNATRQGSGNLKALAPGLSADSLLTDLLYERRYSLMWEQGTRWIDARRYGRLSTIPIDVTQPTPGHVPPVMPVPSTECQARGLGNVCTPSATAQ
jgi:starch-binding outer membrane protein, SusD/RagB family